MNKYYLPIDFNKLPIDSSSVIDMADLRFGDISDNPKRSAMIFIRNMNISNSLSFDSCSYKDKEEYLLKYILDDISIHNIEFIATWISILSSSKGLDFFDERSFLSKEEINTFIKDHEELISDIIYLILSIPICAMYSFSSINNIDLGLDQIELTDWNEINIYNFINITSHPNFILLIDTDGKVKPMIYTKYFNKSRKDVVDSLNSNFPYFNMLQLMFNNDEYKNAFISTIKDILK